ncbi:MAG: S-layer homology domain-containing protein [Oscillospiraceae bacterium]|nr:S-layer homology domain-containing protein [Oscillospiraceae bacterium]
MKQRITRLVALIALIAAIFTLTVPMASAQQAANARQKAVVDTALAYYYKGKPMQYDSIALSNIGKGVGGDDRRSYQVAPEVATKDNTVYTVCSAFCYEVYYNAIGFEIAKGPRNTANVSLIADNVGNIIYTHTKGDSAEKVKDILQVGDIVIASKASSAVGDVSGWHAMIYVGDAFGDGKDYLVHSAGSKYNINSGTDAYENYTEESTSRSKAIGHGGNIRRDTVDDYIYADKGSYNPNTCDAFYLLRPLDVAKAGQYPITPAAQGRAKFPNIVIDRTVSTGMFGSVETGEELTYTIEITNESDKAYSSLPVKETVPVGTTLKSGSIVGGGNASGNQISWTLNVAPGETAKLAYTVTVTAKRGEKIVAGGGSVSTIPSNTLTTEICGKKPAAKTADQLIQLGAAFKSQSGVEFVNSLYAAAYGVKLELPAPGVMARNVFEFSRTEGVTDNAVHPTDTPREGYETIHKMLIDKYYGGKEFNTGELNARVQELRPDQLQSGDIFVTAKNLFASGEKTVNAYIVSSDGKLVYCDGRKVTTASENVYTRAHSCGFFYALRPSLAYDNMMVEAKADVPLPFTDVKTNDWFYTYVKDLYTDGTVNGMTATTFVPSGNLTYGQALKLIVCALGNPEQAKTGSHWASGYLTFAKNNGWLANDVNLDGAVSRLAFCQIAAKAKNLTEQPASNPFTDTSDASVLALNKAGVINGMTATTFQPGGILTRAQISKIIWLLRSL